MNDDEIEKVVPCKDCTKRTPTCHSENECPLYAEWFEKHKEFAKRERKRRNEALGYIDYYATRK